MPAPKFDLSTPSGRIQYAREQAGYSQTGFAELMGYDSNSGWQKVEQGKTEVTFTHIVRANEILKLDVRYYFGLLSYEQAASRTPRTYEDLVEVLEEQRATIQVMQEKVAPKENLDPITDRVRINQRLREIVGMFYTEPSNVLDQVQVGVGMALGYAKGTLKAAKDAESVEAAQSDGADNRAVG